LTGTSGLDRLDQNTSDKSKRYPKVIGLTGTIASGKDVVRKYLQNRLHPYVISLSSVIELELSRNNQDISRQSLQDKGNELRKKKGTNILVKMALADVPQNQMLTVIDGIRNLGEVSYLRSTFGRNFVLIAIDAPLKTRYNRFVQRRKPTDRRSLGEFREIDRRDRGFEEPEFGQHTQRCIREADFRIRNVSTVKTLLKKLEKPLGSFLAT
jgi:dephospho-CoA kinase